MAAARCSGVMWEDVAQPASKAMAASTSKRLHSCMYPLPSARDAGSVEARSNSWQATRSATAREYAIGQSARTRLAPVGCSVLAGINVQSDGNAHLECRATEHGPEASLNRVPHAGRAGLSSTLPAGVQCCHGREVLPSVALVAPMPSTGVSRIPERWNVTKPRLAGPPQQAGMGAACKMRVSGIIKRNGQVKAMPIARHKHFHPFIWAKFATAS